MNYRKIYILPSLVFDIGYRIIDRFLMYSFINKFPSVGSNVKFYPISSSFVYKNINIGNDVHIGRNASFMTYIASIC